MTRRHTGRHLLHALLALGCALLALPAVALAGSSSGGGGLGGGTGTTGTGTSGTGKTGTSTAPTASQARPVSATGNGVTLTTSASAVQRGALAFSGTAPGAIGRTLEIERRGSATDGRWTPTVTATVSATGTFLAHWRPSQPGRLAVRAVLTTAVATDVATAASAAPTLTVTVYPTAKATIYGPGFYGRKTACGATLTRTTLGVANRTLPCGTKVSILYDGRTLTVPVIDRGPFANGASFDLTTATAQALGMPGTEWIGAVPATRTLAAAARRSGL